MQFFYVKKNVCLHLPHKRKDLLAPQDYELAQNKIPTHCVYCGFIAWELIQAQNQIGENNVVWINQSQISKTHLPEMIKPYSIAGSLFDQIKQTIKLDCTNSPRDGVTIALINGTGTMLGDTLVGASILNTVVDCLANKGINILVDVFVAWNARPGVEEIWERMPFIRNVYGSSVKLSDLKNYNCYWDYSHLLKMSGYNSEHFADFYLNHFGLDPNAFTQNLKVPRISLNLDDFKDTKKIIEEFSGGEEFLFIQAEASTPARSMPESFLLELIKGIAKQDTKLVISGKLPNGLTNHERKFILNLQDWTKGNLDRYFSVIALSSKVISVDTLALHIAMGYEKPGIALFSLSDPNIRLKYSPKIKGILIEGARELIYWNQHKSDESWESVKNSYEKAWQVTYTNQLCKFVNNLQEI